MPKKILLVEDEALLSMSEARMLEKHAYEVVTVYKGEKALEIVDSDPEISLILMDIDLGKGISGTEAAEQILRKHNLPIAFLSSHTEAEVVEKTEGITSYGYIVKNSGETVLLASIKMAFKLFEANNRIAQSEQKHRTLFETMSQGVVYHDAEGFIISANPASERVLGLSFDQMKGKTSLDPRWKMVTEDGKDVPGTEHPAMIALRTGEKVGPITRGVFVPEKESYVWLLISATPLFRPGEEKPFQVYATFEDITERKQSEKSLYESEQKYKSLFHRSPVSITIHDKDTGEVVDANRVAFKVYGLNSISEFQKNEFWMEPPYSFHEAQEWILKAAAEGLQQFEWKNRSISGEVFWEYVTLRPVTINNTERVLSTSINITEQKEAKKALREKTEMLNNTLENISELVVLADVSGRITFLNNLYDTIGYEKDSLIGRNVLEFVHPEDRREMETNLTEFIQHKEDKRRVEYRFRCADGSYIWMETDGKTIKDGAGNIKELLLSARDITERKMTREALERSEEKYRLLFHNSNDAIFVHEIGEDGLPGKNIEVNAQASSLLRYSRAELLHLTAKDVVPEKHVPAMRLNTQELMEKQHLTFETENIRSDGLAIPVEVSAYLDTEGNRMLVVSSVRDISKRTQAEKAFIEKTKLLEKSQELANLGAWEWDIAHDICRFSEHWKKIHGVSDNDLTVSKLFEIAYPEDAPHIEKALSDAKEDGKVYNIEHRVIRADNGEIRYIKALGEVEFDQDTGRPVRMVGVAQDITERKKREEAIQTALQEKDHLMKEFNHRVKNNLALVSSLINLKDSETEEDLSGLTHRIDVIKLVHGKLHQRSDIERIEVKEYFQELLESIFASTAEGDVELVNAAVDVSIPTKTAIPLGLVVNEIATNAIKYGFTFDEKARFIIELKEDEAHKHYVLKLSNTGNPFPEDIGLDNPDTMGLQLVSTLVKQLNGTIELQKKPTPVFTIRFPVKEGGTIRAEMMSKHSINPTTKKKS